MNKSESIAKLAEALSKAQGAMKNAIKDSANPFFKSKYADLASVSDACRNELAANGLAIAQLPTMRDGKMVLEYVLMHSSGEFIGSEIEMTPVKSDPQGIGSAITYARRYTLAGITGVATEDDDGNAASGNKGNASKPEFESRPVTFKKSAADNRVQGEPVSTLQEVAQATDSHSGNGAPSAGLGGVVTTSADTPTPPTVEYIAIGQQKNFHKECRAAVREERRMDADILTYQWLADNKFIDNDKLPTAARIPAAGWLKTRDKAIAWIKEQ